MAQKRFQAKYVMPALNSIPKYKKKTAAVFRVQQTTLNLVISRCCFVEEGEEIYKELQCTCKYKELQCITPFLVGFSKPLSSSFLKPKINNFIFQYVCFLSVSLINQFALTKSEGNCGEMTKKIIEDVFNVKV